MTLAALEALLNDIGAQFRRRPNPEVVMSNAFARVFIDAMAEHKGWQAPTGRGPLPPIEWNDVPVVVADVPLDVKRRGGRVEYNDWFVRSRV